MTKPLSKEYLLSKKNVVGVNAQTAHIFLNGTRRVLKHMTNKKHAKIIARTIFYQFLILFTGVSIGFIYQPQYWGNRAPIIERSVKHIFFPIEYDKDVEKFVIKIGRSRLYYETVTKFNGLPELFEIVKDSEWVEGEERYHCEYQYVDEGGNLDVHKYVTRIKWKPWELYFPDPENPDEN